MNKKTKSDLIAKLLTISEDTEVSFKVVKEPKMKKIGNDFYGRVVAEKLYSAVIGFDLVDGGERSWGEHRSKCLVEYKNHVYLHTRANKVIEESYSVDKIPVNKSTVEPWLVNSDSEIKDHDLEDVVWFKIGETVFE